MDKEFYADIADFIGEKKADTQLEFVFDDQPIEEILYGKKKVSYGAYNKADIYMPAMDHVRSMEKLIRSGNITGVLRKASELGSKWHPINADLIIRLSKILAQLIPDYPVPILKYDIVSLGLLLEKVWGMCTQEDMKDQYQCIGWLMFRWYEHQERYDNARSVLLDMINHFQRKHDSKVEAALLNEYAFEYLLEKKWGEALPLFVEAARISLGENEDETYAVSRSNYWICRLEIDGCIDLAQNEHELQALAYILTKNGSWQARMPFILLAKIEEYRGDIFQTLEYATMAIQSTRLIKTYYTLWDKEYLKSLRLRI